MKPKPDFVIAGIASVPTKSSKGWSAKLARVIEIKGGPKLLTLADARAFILNLPKNRHSSIWWPRSVGDFPKTVTSRART
jgi:hypothetical protein